MAKERVVSREALESDAVVERTAPAIRPARIDDYVGQPELVERVSIALQAVRERGDPMEHVLLHGPPGLGKTTLAHVIANEMGTRAVVTSGPALTRPGDLVGTLTRLEAGDVLFIDEIHRLPAAVEEYIYPAMEDCRVDFTVDSGMHAKIITLTLKPFTLIGATTRAGLLTHALRSRFGIAHHLGFYGHDELVRILRRAATILGVGDAGTLDGRALDAIAERSRGTPRVAIRLLRRVRDYAQVRCDGRLGGEAVEGALELEGVDRLGLDDLDRRYLRTMAEVYGGGPVGLEAVAATLADDAGTLEDLVEPYLLQIGFVARTRQGRQLTAKAWAHLGLTPPKSGAAGAPRMFDDP